MPAAPGSARCCRASCAAMKPPISGSVQGSHVVVRKLWDHGRSYIFQNADGRIIFAIPYESDFTLIGTTDRDYASDPCPGQGEPRRDRLSLRRRERIFRPADYAGRCRLDLFVVRAAL